MGHELSANLFYSRHDKFVSLTSLTPYYRQSGFNAWSMYGRFSVRTHRLNNSIYTLYKIDKELLLRVRV